MARRGHYLSISTILKKAQRQGASAYTMDILLERLRNLSGQQRKNITDDSPINVNRMLQDGIRLHPFLIQQGPIRPEQLEDLRLESPQARRRAAAERVTEDLSLPDQEEAAGTSQGVEDLSIPNPLLEGVDIIEVE